MGGNRYTHRSLPPPVETILLYAADGLAVKHNHLTPTGKPRHPDHSQWIPIFRRLIDTQEGMHDLQDLAHTGMRAWNVGDSEILLLDHAFREVTFRALAIAALQRLDDTTYKSPRATELAGFSYRRPAQPLQRPKQHYSQIKEPPAPKPSKHPHRPHSHHRPHGHKPAR